MNDQLSLFEGGDGFNPVLAVFPEHYAAQQIGELGNSLLKMHGLRGKPRPVTHLHVSLHIPKHVMRSPETVIERISRVCKTVATNMSPFEIKFDRVMRFGGGVGNHPLVLVNENHERDGIQNLHRLLWAEFAKLGRRSSSPRKFTPHLTLLYDQQKFATMSVTPVSWWVKEIVLVHSEVGATKYHRLECWELAGGQAI